MPDGLQAYCRKCSAEYYRQRQEAKGKKVREKIAVPPGHKRCPQCELVKPHAEWERNKSSSDGWASYCRECRAERNRISYFKRRYGLTPRSWRRSWPNSGESAAYVLPPRRSMWITATRRVGSVA